MKCQNINESLIVNRIKFNYGQLHGIADNQKEDIVRTPDMLCKESRHSLAYCISAFARRTVSCWIRRSLQGFARAER
jgi:hypothetical protein